MKFLLWLLLCATVSGAEIIPGPVAPEHSFVRVRPAPGERVWVLPWQSAATVEVEQSAAGDILFVGPPGQYAVLWFSETGQGQAFVTISGDAPVPPGPGPDVPTGFAGEVYAEAKKVGRPQDASRLADNFRSVSSAIRAGGIKTVEQAKAEITRLNNGLGLDASWKPFGTWVGAQANKRAQTLPATVTFFNDCVTGLEAVK